MLNSTPVRTAFELVFALSGRKIKLYSYLESFNELWGVENGLEQFIKNLAGSGIEEIVVVWDDVPEGNTASVNTALYLTPIDWAVAFSLAACQNEKDKPNFRITIIDLNSDTSASAPAVRFVNHFPRRDIMSMPWIRLVRPIYCATDKSGQQVDERDIKDVILELLSGCPEDGKFKTLFQIFTSNPSHDVDVVRSVWRSNLVKTPNPDDNHAIANLLGPLLLSGSFQTGSKAETESGNFGDVGSKQKPSDNVTALRNLLKEIGLFPSDSGVAPNQTEKSKKMWRELSSRLGKNNIKILLIDDQWRDGWGKALCSLLGTNFIDPGKEAKDEEGFVTISDNNGFVIKACSNPERIINKLNKISSDQRFKLRLDDEDDRMEMLCLDLRLFTGNDMGREVKVIKDIIGIARKIKDKKLKEPWDLPWNGFGEKELDDISVWAVEAKDKVSRDNPHYHQALTLLPRVIAEIDMSYPVIIFSSTGRREIAKKFDGCENILAEFEKPRFNGLMNKDAVEESRLQLLQMLIKASAIIESQKLLNKLTAVNAPLLFSDCDPKPGHVHVELFIDEYHPGGQKFSDRNNIWVGGCYAMFVGDNKSAAIGKAYKFDDALVEHGYTYFSRGKYLPNIPDAAKVKAKSDDAFQELKAVHNNAYWPFRIEPVRLKCDLRSDAIKNDETGDHAYREALTMISELFIYELLPHIKMELPETKVSLSIYAGTRFTEHDGKSLDFIKELGYKFGLIYFKDKFEANKYLLESLSESTLFPLIDDLHRYREIKDDYSRILELERAVAIKMIYDKGYDGKPKFDKKNYTGRVICRKCRTIHEVPVDMTSNEILTLNADEYYGKVFKVSIDKNGNDFALLDLENSTAGDTQSTQTGKRSVYVNKRIVRNKLLQVNDTVIVKLHLGQQGYEVQDLNKYNFSDRYGNDYKIHWEEDLGCLNCNDISMLRPEYPGGIYIADQIMNKDFHFGEYKDLLKIEKWGFDEEINPNLRRLRDSGRSVDSKNRVRGAWLASKAIKEIGEGDLTNLHRQILSRISPKLSEISGREFHEYSTALGIDKEPWDHWVTNKECIEIVKIQVSQDQKFAKLICKRKNKDLVIVSSNQTEKAKINKDMIKVGARLNGVLTQNKDGLYASEIELVNI